MDADEKREQQEVNNVKEALTKNGGPRWMNARYNSGYYDHSEHGKDRLRNDLDALKRSFQK